MSKKRSLIEEIHDIIMADKQFYTWIGAICLVALIYVLAKWSYESKLEEECWNETGVLVEGKRGWYCVKQSAIIQRDKK